MGGLLEVQIRKHERADDRANSFFEERACLADVGHERLELTTRQMETCGGFEDSVCLFCWEVRTMKMRRKVQKNLSGARTFVVLHSHGHKCRLSVAQMDRRVSK